MYPWNMWLYFRSMGSQVLQYRRSVKYPDTHTQGIPVVLQSFCSDMHSWGIPEEYPNWAYTRFMGKNSNAKTSNTESTQLVRASRLKIKEDMIFWIPRTFGLKIYVVYAFWLGLYRFFRGSSPSRRNCSVDGFNSCKSANRLFRETLFALGFVLKALNLF